MNVQIVRKVLGACLLFGVLILLIIDAGLYGMSGSYTISAFIASYLHSSPTTIAATAFGFVMGGLMVHFTGFNQQPNPELNDEKV